MKIIGHSHGKQWTDELVKSEIMRVVDSLGLDTFPTHSEIENFYGNKGLTMKISKSGGTKYWAEQLGLNIKSCESEFGDFYEKYSINDILNNTGLNSYQNKVGYPYDVTTNKHIKVDIKASSVAENNNGYKYNTFNLGKEEPTCDIFIFYCLNEDNNIHKTLIIPSCKLYNQTQLGTSVHGNSKWDKYINNWNIFKKYNEFYNSILR